MKPATVARRPNGVGQVRDLIGRWNRRTLTRVGLLVVACYGAVQAIAVFGRPYTFFDMRIYRGAVSAWAGGGDLYGYVTPDSGLGFTYPPFAAMTMLPIAYLPVGLAGRINLVASVVALAAVLAGLLVPLARRYGWSPWFTVALALPLAIAVEPVRESLGYGQVNILLFALIIGDVIGLRWRARSVLRRSAGVPGPGGGPPLTVGGRLRGLWFSGAWAGAGIGLATAIKLTPVLFIGYLLVTRQWRAAATAAGTAVAVTAGGFLLAAHESATYFGSVLWATERVGVADMTPNQSLAGLLARLYDSTETPGLIWLAFSLLLLVLGLTRAANAHSEGDELTAFTLVGLTANVISPISWTHHLVFVLPAIIVLADAALRRRMASRGLAARSLAAARAGRSGAPGPLPIPGLRTPIWYPTLTGARHAAAAVALYVLFLVSPIWPFEHKLVGPGDTHYADGLLGALAENSLAIALIILVAALPWRPGAEVHAEPLRVATAQIRRPVPAQPR